MDAIDRKLLELLQDDCSLSYAVLGERVGLSISAVNDRVRKLKDQSIITRYSVRVEPVAVGRPLLAFLRLKTDPTKGTKKLIRSLETLPEVQEIHQITGAYNLMVKLRLRDVDHYETILSESLKDLPNVTEILPEIVLSSYKETSFIPCREQDDL